MNIKDLFLKQTRHNLWANRRIVEWLGDKPADEIRREIASSFAGILPTLAHLAQVQEFWFTVITAAQANAFVAPEDFETICRNYLKVSENLVELVAEADEKSFGEQVIFHAPNVGEVRQKRADLLTQCLTHNIYHRGQIVTLGRALGYADAPMTDYLFYLFTENFAG